MSTAHTSFVVEAPLAWLTFDRPEARNAMTWDMYAALMDACDRVDGDDAVRVFVLRGAGGKAFVAGTDIAQFEAFHSREDALAYEARINQVLDRLEHVTKPTIAQIQGVAAGGGCAMALSCDLRVASPESTLGIPIARTLGNCLSAATHGRLLDLVGPAIVKDMLFTGRFIAAAEAHALGLVSRVAGADNLEHVVRELALDIAANAPLTLRATKEMIRRLTMKRRLAPGEDHDLIETCYTSGDFREGVASFLGKRKPRWTGK